jgi:hypothetical protein
VDSQIPEGDSEAHGSSECMDTMEDDLSSPDVDREQSGHDVNSGTRVTPRGRGSRGPGRGRGRGRGRHRGRSRTRGKGRTNFAFQVLQEERELEQNCDASALVKVG